MAQFTLSLCEEVIRKKGRVGLTENEKLQLAYLAKKELERPPVLPGPPANDSPSCEREQG
jgi:hypothetical protein